LKGVNLYEWLEKNIVNWFIYVFSCSNISQSYKNHRNTIIFYHRMKTSWSALHNPLLIEGPCLWQAIDWFGSVDYQLAGYPLEICQQSISWSFLFAWYQFVILRSLLFFISRWSCLWHQNLLVTNFDDRHWKVLKVGWQIDSFNGLFHPILTILCRFIFRHFSIQRFQAQHLDQDYRCWKMPHRCTYQSQ